MAGTERERGTARSRAQRGSERAERGRGGPGETGGRASEPGQGERLERGGRVGSKKGAAQRGPSGTAGEAAAAARRNGVARAGKAPAVVDRVDEPVAVGGHAMIDLDFLRGLIDAVDASGIDSIEIARAGTRIRISKTPPPAAVVAAPAAPVAALPPEATLVTPGAPTAALPTRGGADAPATPGPEPALRTDLVEVKSPMVGTFYRAPAPEAPPYVEVGSHVTKGQTLCILEAMKLMNELESEVDGIVREVLVENTEPVEFGQVLFRIEPTKR